MMHVVFQGYVQYIVNKKIYIGIKVYNFKMNFHEI